MTRRINTTIDPDILADWRDAAACYGRGDLMAARHPDDVIEAKRICFACPVIDPCRAGALATPGQDDPDEVRGGLTHDDRRRWRRRMALAKARSA